eukprot:2142504-Pyramimonas_sp.AAC.1
MVCRIAPNTNDSGRGTTGRGGGRVDRGRGLLWSGRNEFSSATRGQSGNRNLNMHRHPKSSLLTPY